VKCYFCYGQGLCEVLSAALTGKTNVECWPAAKDADTALIANRKLRNLRLTKVFESKIK